MASDSAVTVDGMKAFNGVQKIFNLDNTIPIGIMVNGPARFCGKSFKKLIDEFKCIKFKGEYSVENVKDNFIEFLEEMDISINVERFVWYQLSMFKKNLIYEFEGITEDEFEFFIDMLKKHEIYDFFT